MRTRRIWNWKRLGFLFALAGAHALFAESKSLHSFEDWKWDYPQGIGFWADSESKKPAFKRSEEAVDGKYALQVEFFGYFLHPTLRQAGLGRRKCIQIYGYEIRIAFGSLHDQCGFADTSATADDNKATEPLVSNNLELAV